MYLPFPPHASSVGRISSSPWVGGMVLPLGPPCFDVRPAALLDLGYESEHNLGYQCIAGVECQAGVLSCQILPQRKV